MTTRAWFIGLLLGLAISTPADACGPDTDCEIGDRFYRVRMPAGHDGAARIGAIIFAHGYRGTATGVMRNQGLAAVAADLGVALIAVKSAGDDWSIPGAPAMGSIAGVDELAYFDRVVADAAARFPIDADRLMVTGFSAGGMMVWTLACHRSQRFAGFAPMAGTFWRPTPETCTTPAASVVHIHGDADRIVPLDGRKIEEAHQGDVASVIDMYARYGGFGAPAAREMEGLSCQNRRNAVGHILNFCLFSGGHSFDAAVVRQAWEMLAEAGRL
ncbi:MAG: dienelactone hydrolase family protein [Alphaproteobacteria bacterium]|nr:dienelactone hydrolase family protein [Alphaproteobacteria bacterium]